MEDDSLIKQLLDHLGISFPDAEPTEAFVQGDKATRQQIAELIAKTPHKYKVCCGCEAVIRERAPICPQCFAYRFEDDPKTVVAHALYLAKTEPKDQWLD